MRTNPIPKLSVKIAQDAKPYEAPPEMVEYDKHWDFVNQIRFTHLCNLQDNQMTSMPGGRNRHEPVNIDNRPYYYLKLRKNRFSAILRWLWLT